MVDAQEHTIEQQVLDSANAIRLKISHVYYVIVSIFVLPALVASFSRLSEIDFLPIMGLQLVLSIIIWTIALLRKKIPYIALSRSLIIMNAIIGIAGIAQFGLLSGGIGYLIIMGPAAAIFCGRRGGIIGLTLMLFASILVAVSFTSGFTAYGFDLDSYVLSPSTWSMSVLGWFISSGTLTAGLVVFNESLFDTLAKSKRQEMDLLKSREQLAYVLEGSQLGFWDWNAVTDEFHLSSEYKAMFGYTEEEAGNQLSEWEKLIHPDDIDHYYASADAHLKGKTPFYESEYRVLCKDGSYKWILDRGKVMSWNEDGTPLRVAGTYEDVTRRKEAELKRQRLTAELKEALDNVEALSGLLPICASCKNVRNSNGKWDPVEIYISKHSEADFSHGICPECVKKLYPEIDLYSN